MNIESFREYCLSLPCTEEGFPFDNSTLVFKVAGKIFALTNIDQFESINLKCDPEKALELREKYDAIKPGYHMSKKHWNTIKIDHSISDKLIVQWTKDSYDLVVKGLPKNVQKEIQKGS
jgi:predicted DNA-binding protein (MmcQ/YjbR family)